jgi:hypothetical protein
LDRYLPAITLAQAKRAGLPRQDGMTDRIILIKGRPPIGQKKNILCVSVVKNITASLKEHICIQRKNSLPAKGLAGK